MSQDTNNRKVIIGVMGPGTNATTTDVTYAYDLGQLIARQQWLVLSGGVNVGVMDAVSRGAKDAGGLTIGIIPTSDPDTISAAIDIPIVTDMGSARNNINVLSSHIVIACGMSAGTASEVALAIRAGKNTILLNNPAASATFFQSLSTTNVFVARDPASAVAIAKELLQQTPKL